jgi:hypothetical protein
MLSKTSAWFFTDAYTEAWKPSQKPFMTVIVSFANEGQKITSGIRGSRQDETRYTARALPRNKHVRAASHRIG